MPEIIPINYAAVVVCAFINMSVGFAWYGPIYGKEWVKLANIDPAKIMAAKKGGMGKTYALAMLGALLMAYVMAHAMIFAEAYLKTTGVASGLMGGVWNWLGFVAPVSLGLVLWEGKPWKLWWINSGYYLVVLCAMGVVFSLWK